MDDFNEMGCLYEMTEIQRWKNIFQAILTIKIFIWINNNQQKVEASKIKKYTLALCYVVNTRLHMFVELGQTAVDILNHIAHISELMKSLKVVLVFFAFFVTLGHFVVKLIAKEVMTEQNY